MFTEEELQTLKSCWVLPDGKLWSVQPEQHDNYLPDGYYDENWDYNKSISEVEKKCFRMSFSWGWDAQISQMTISESCELTETQYQVIKYLVLSKTITIRQIEYYGNDEAFYTFLTEVEKELKKQSMKESDKFMEMHDKIKSFLDVKDFKSVNGVYTIL